MKLNKNQIEVLRMVGRGQEAIPPRTVLGLVRKRLIRYSPTCGGWVLTDAGRAELRKRMKPITNTENFVFRRVYLIEDDSLTVSQTKRWAESRLTDDATVRNIRITDPPQIEILGGVVRCEATGRAMPGKTVPMMYRYAVPVAELIAQGLTDRETARILGLPNGRAVYDIRRHNGIPSSHPKVKQRAGGQ